MFPIIETASLVHRFGRRSVLREVDLSVAEGSIYALLGPNGAGKTTLLKVLLGLLRPTRGRVSLLGKELSRLTDADRAEISYVAEGQALPGWMTLEALERWLAPLYPKWDFALADELRESFRLPARRKLKSLSRGEGMKAALLAALAPRPRLLIMDEPFTGMDALVKDELVRGLLSTVSAHGCSVLLCSHDIGELEMLADEVGFLDRGRLTVSEPMDVLRSRFRHVDVRMNGGAFVSTESLPPDWIAVERSGGRFAFLIRDHGVPSSEEEVRRRFPGAARIEIRPASLREIFVGLAREANEGDVWEEEVA